MSKPYTAAQQFLINSDNWADIVKQQTRILVANMEASTAYPGALRSTPCAGVSILFDTGIATLNSNGIRCCAHGLCEDVELYWDTPEQLHVWLHQHLAAVLKPPRKSEHDCFYKPLTVKEYPNIVSYESVIADLPYPLGETRTCSMDIFIKRYNNSPMQICYFTKRGVINTTDNLIDHDDVYACLFAYVLGPIRTSYIVYKGNAFVNKCLNDIYGIDRKPLNVAIRRSQLAELKSYLGLIDN